MKIKNLNGFIEAYLYDKRGKVSQTHLIAATKMHELFASTTEFETSQRDQLTIEQFDKLAEVEIAKTKMNRLIWDDNMLAMQALLASGYEGKINLIYIDPPLWTGEDHYANFVVEGKAITKEPSVIEKEY